MGEKRDAERTRRALLDAALLEFAAKGRAGARVSEIAARAGVNKQLISHYFGGKDGLYAALVARWLEREAEFSRSDLALGDLVARYVRDSVEDRDMHRLFVREALEDELGAHGGEDAGPDEDDLADLVARQARGEIADDLDPAFLFLVLQAAATAGVTFPGDVRKLTGLDPASQEFAERYGEQLRRITERLAARPAPGARRRRASSAKPSG